MPGTPSDSPASRMPGRHATRPDQIPLRGWWQIARRAFTRSRADNVPMLAGGVAFFSFLSLFPALMAAVTTYGLLADPEEVAEQFGQFASLLPLSARPLIAEQLSSLATSSHHALGFGLVVSLLGALWTASGGMANLVTAVNLAYDEHETRGYLRLRGVALGLTLGAMLFVLLALALVAVVPVVFDAVGLRGGGLVLAQVLRWVLLAGLALGALAATYRIAPDRKPPRLMWASVGAVFATLLWLLGSVGFSLYADHLGSYNKTYGTLAGVVVLMLWLYLTSYVVLLGAEINAQSELQTERDTTVGPPAPAGQRSAHAADHTAPEPA